MATTLQFRRDTTSNLASVTGSVGELFVDTTKDTVVVMDGSTAGGFTLARETTTQAAFNAANTAVNNAASASQYANTGINNAASASLYANTGVTLAQAAFNQANTGGSDQYARDTANSAGIFANTGINNAASASLYANTGITLAQASFNRANTGANNTTTANATFTNYAVTTNALGSGSGSRTIDLSLGNFVTATVTGTTTWTFSNPVSSPNACGFVLELTNGGSATQNWPAAVRWPGGTAPTLTTSGVDILIFITDDGGTNWRGVASMLDSK
jgi:hypothetical protein